MILEWKDPTPSRGRDWTAIVAELRQHPNQWAVVADVSPSSAGTLVSEIRHGGYVAFRPAGTFDAVSRGGRVFARYIGDD